VARVLAEHPAIAQVSHDVLSMKRSGVPHEDTEPVLGLHGHRRRSCGVIFQGPEDVRFARLAPPEPHGRVWALLPQRRTAAGARGGPRRAAAPRLMRWASAVLLLALAGCGGAAHDRTARRCVGPSDHWYGQALLHVPPGAPARRPLLVAFHGGGQSGASFAQYTGLSRFADRHGFAVLYPTAAGPRRFWSLNRDFRPDDIPRLAALLRRAEPAACADPARLYAAGFSNGGGFAGRAVCELPGFAALASVAGGYGKLDPCPAGRRVSLLEIHSTDDDGVPYRPGIRRYIDGWARRDGCRPAPRSARLGGYARRLTFPGCADGLRVEHIVIRGDPHYWYEHSNERIWRFLQRLGD
jgi:polyhydroxybutyrate depolymerase